MAGFAGSGLGTLGKIGGSNAGLPKPPKVGQPLKVAGASVGKVGTGGLTYAGAPASVAAKVPKPPKATGAPKPTANPDAAPEAAATPAPAQAPSGGSSGSFPPLDPTAIANIAAYITKTNNSIGALQGTAGTDQNAYQTNLHALQQAQPLANLKAATTNNAHGGFYSSSYGQQLGNINNQYQSKEGTLASNLQNALAAIATKIAGLQGGISPYEDQQAAASAARLAALAAATPVPAPAPAPVNAAPAVSSPALPSVAAAPNQPVVNTRATAKAAQAKGKGKQQAGFRLVG